MKLNEHQALLTPKVLLVPYSVHHVPTYHGWMKDEDLQKATASEPLTLSEEYSMQKSWRSDHDKLTFIVCTCPFSMGELERKDIRITPEKEDDPNAMIGDVNLFLYVDDESETEDVAKEMKQSAEGKWQGVVGEVEIMIARKDFQGKRLGKEILLTFLWYIISSTSRVCTEFQQGLGTTGTKTRSYLKYLRVKIDAENKRSITLFESVGFMKVADEPNYFGELELQLPIATSLEQDLVRRLEAAPLVVNYN